eukprot:85809-Amphidinium_carterae.1
MQIFNMRRRKGILTDPSVGRLEMGGDVLLAPSTTTLVEEHLVSSDLHAGRFTQSTETLNMRLRGWFGGALQGTKMETLNPTCRTGLAMLNIAEHRIFGDGMAWWLCLLQLVVFCCRYSSVLARLCGHCGVPTPQS